MKPEPPFLRPAATTVIERPGEPAREYKPFDGQRHVFPPSWLNEFHRLNAIRCERDFAPAHGPIALVACITEECGEIAAAVLGVAGEKKRKAHLTRVDVLDGVADAITYLSLLAHRMGCTNLQELLSSTFNMVSDRCGSDIKVP